MSDLHTAARRWMEDDPDPRTRAEIQDLLDGKDDQELADRFRGRLEFGTAGIRGPLGAGPSRMNTALVRKVTAGLAAYLLDQVPGARTAGVVVGRDARRMSPEFAAAAAEVLAGAGIPVHAFNRPVPTPVCAHAVTALRAAAGIVVTASHNPPADNGYKVYAANGAQIVPPADREISRAIDAVSSILAVPVLDEEEARRRGLLHEVPPEVEHAYLESVAGLRRHPEIHPRIRVVYTPLHGVGGEWVEKAFGRAGFQDLHVVPEQFEPDGEFPTVPFPNPEEPGAMDLALDLARKLDADLVLANDPDADRLAASVRDTRGSYRVLTGNEIGCLLAHYLLTQNPKAEDPLVMTTVVSSRLLQKMAGELEAAYEETLTGFKWIATRAMDLKASRGLDFVFGFEEALGYTVGEGVRDKDGVGAAVVFAELAAWCKDRGVTVVGYLEEISRRFGVHATGQKSLTLPGATGMEKIQGIMSGLRGNPPRTIGEAAVQTFTDLKQGFRRERDGKESPVDLPSSNVLAFDLEDGSRILARPSGTEPKIKFYFEVAASLPEDAGFAETEAAQKERLAGLMTAFLGMIPTRAG